MIVRTLEQMKGTEREVDAPNWVSRRLLLRKDHMGFSFHDTTIRAGTETHIHYKNHLEAVYCVGGEGEIEDLKTGEVHKLHDGVMYALNEHDEHYLRATKDLRMICVFNPPLTGREIHDENGVYPLITDDDEEAGNVAS